MDVNTALTKIRNIVNEEKKQLDSILKGAELLAEMLSAQEQSGNKGKQEVEHSQPGMASRQDGSQDGILYSAP